MTSLITRLAHRVRLACDEWIERVEDAQTGHRDHYGRKTHLWHEREYEIARRQKQRQARRKEKKGIEGEKAEDEGNRGKGEKVKKGLEVGEVVMSGAIKKENWGRSKNGEEGGKPGEERAGSEEIRGRSHTSHQGSDGDVTLIEERAVNREGPIVTTTEVAEGTATEVAEGTARPRSISPMPSEHSASSIQVHVRFRRGEGRGERRGRSGAGNQHDAPSDSEEEEADDPSDDDDASNEGEDEATKAAKAAKTPEGPPDDGGATPGLRGGGGSGIAELEDDEDDEERWYSFGEEEEGYNGHEDFDDEYKTDNADQKDTKVLDHVAENDGPGLGTKAGPAANPDHGEDIKLHTLSKDDRVPWKDHPKPGPSPAVHQTAEPKHGQDNGVSAKHNAGQVSNREYTETDSSEQATKQKLESCAEDIAQFSSHQGARPPHPAVLSENRSKTGNAVATEQRGKPGDRKSRPYGLAGVGEKTEVHRGEPGRLIVWNRDDCGTADIKAGPSEHSRRRAAGNTEPTFKARSTQANTEPATAHAPDSAQAGSSENWSRPPRAAAAKPRVPGRFPEADFVTDDAWYNEQLFGQEKPRRTGHAYRGQGARRYEEASYPDDGARNTTSDANESRRRDQGGPRLRVVNTDEEYIADGPFTDGPFRGAIPQTRRIYRGGPYQSFDSWNDGVHWGTPYSGTHTPHFAGSEPFRAPGGGARRTGGPSYAEARPSRGRGPARGKKVQPESSEDDDSSSDNAVDPSPSPSPPPQRRRTKQTGERSSGQGRQPPGYQEVDSSKTAPLNHYAILGLNRKASAKEVEVAGKNMRIQTHPDKLLKAGMSEEEMVKINARSARVGQAHELLKDPIQRSAYDGEVREWERKHGGVLPPEAE
ncbi:MAG: hypothetical protein Q9184_002866 [Pyrenodesmia sp. 2 TL-2023]